MLLKAGAEKVVLNTHAIISPNLIEDVAAIFGSQSIVICVDVKKVFSANTRFL